jgi:hypothetical protein
VTEVPVPVPFGPGKPARMISVALFGDLALYPLPPTDPDRRRDIGYSLFNARSAALGLAICGDGEVNEGAGLVASFQLTHSDDDDLAPVQPFLAVVEDVVTRLGRVRLDAVQVSMPAPEPERGAAERDVLGFSGDWFALRDTDLWVPVRITLDSPDERIASVAPVAMHRQAMYEDVFRFDALSEDHLVLPGPFEHPGDAHYRVTFTGKLAEWSLDALGFLAAFLDDLAATEGIAAPLTLNAASEERGKR